MQFCLFFGGGIFFSFNLIFLPNKVHHKHFRRCYFLDFVAKRTRQMSFMINSRPNLPQWKFESKKLCLELKYLFEVRREFNH